MTVTHEATSASPTTLSHEDPHTTDPAAHVGQCDNLRLKRNEHLKEFVQMPVTPEPMAQAKHYDPKKLSRGHHPIQPSSSGSHRARTPQVP